MKIIFYLVVICGFSCEKDEMSEVIILMQSKKAIYPIWSGEKHYAFTDITKFNDRYLCAFREGSSHSSIDGRIIVIESDNLSDWVQVANIHVNRNDLRDPKFIALNGDTLLLHFYSREIVDRDQVIHSVNRVCHSTDGLEFSEPIETNITNAWLWAPKMFNDTIYCIGYSKKNIPELFKSFDGITYLSIHKFEELQNKGATEASIVFLQNDSMNILFRAKGTGFLVSGSYPYKSWNYRKMDINVEGPNLLHYADNKIIVAGRIVDSVGNKSIIGKINNSQIDIYEYLTPIGDNGYPGLLVENKEVIISYYSGGYDIAAIYLVKLKLNDIYNQEN